LIDRSGAALVPYDLIQTLRRPRIPSDAHRFIAQPIACRAAIAWWAVDLGPSGATVAARLQGVLHAVVGRRRRRQVARRTLGDGLMGTLLGWARDAMPTCWALVIARKSRSPPQASRATRTDASADAAAEAAPVRAARRCRLLTVARASMLAPCMASTAASARAIAGLGQ